MTGEKKYYKYLDLIRLISCIAVFLYHLNILKGGYLAVCTFFVLTGFLTCVSSFKKEKFSVLSYYKNRLLHIYLPLLIVCFITIVVYNLISSFNWINLKPETTSVIFGYNNFWQLNANLDYFTRNISSPFMHFWFIGIILQFEIIFPLVFIILKKVGDKLSKVTPCLFMTIISIVSLYYLYISSNSFDLMSLYYNSFTRIFSILFGVTIGFIYSYYKNYIPNFLSSKFIKNEIFILYLASLVYLFIFSNAESGSIVLLFIIATFISLRLIKYATTIESSDNSLISKIIKKCASISYEIYLIQYPVIFFFQEVSMDIVYKNILIVLITVLLSIILHFSLNYKKNNDGIIKFKIFRIAILLLILVPTFFGGYQYVIAKDHTEEMKELEKQMENNEKLLESKKEEYEKKFEEEQDKWNKVMEDLELGEENIKNIVADLPIVGVGDSVMLGAMRGLYKQFPNGYIDAKVSRTDYEANEILANLSKKGTLGNPIVIALGTNGQCGERCRKVILETCKDRMIFWVNVSNDWEVHVNDDLKKFASEHDNVYLVDWYTASLGHKEYFVADGIHLKAVGVDAYVKTIYDAIYNVYLSEYQKKKQEIIDAHNEEEKTKISFYGNDLLINAFDDLKEKFKDSKFELDKNYTFDSIYNKLKTDLENNKLTYKVILAFDSSLELTNKEYESIIELCKDHEVVLISSTKIDALSESSIDFSKILKDNPDYLMVDKIHLTKKGNDALVKLLDELFK